MQGKGMLRAIAMLPVASQPTTGAPCRGDTVPRSD